MSDADKSTPAPPLKRGYGLPLMIVAAFVLFVTGVGFPFFHVTKFWVFEDAVSVISGLISLAQQGEFFLFAILFTFTLVFPLVKLCLLTAAWWTAPHKPARAERWIRRVGTLSKWSMLDVFVVAILVVVMKAASLAKIEIDVGLYLFTFSVLFTQTATFWLERRIGRARR